MKGDWQLYRFVPATLVMGIIFFLSHQEGTSLTLPPIPHIDKAAHFLLYGLLAATFLFVFPVNLLKYHPVQTGGMVVLLCLAYGITDELHQGYIPGRDVSMGDLIADVSGAAVTVLFLFLLYKRGFLHFNERH